LNFHYKKDWYKGLWQYFAKPLLCAGRFISTKFNLKIMKYEIHIGEIFDLTTKSKKPKQILIITQDQLAVIEQFADQRKDAELNTIYRLNECEFRIFPHFDLGVVK
jgi:hypothetical protein